MSELIRKLKEKKYITKIKIKDDISDELLSKEIPQVGSVKIVAAVKEEIGPVRPPYAVMRETNPELMDVCVANGWAANSDYMTYEEAAAITDDMLAPHSYPVLNGRESGYCSKFIILEDMSMRGMGKSTIKTCPKSLDELQYFTGITASPLSIAAYTIDEDDSFYSICGEMYSITFPENLTEIRSFTFCYPSRISPTKYLNKIKFLSQTPPQYNSLNVITSESECIKLACADSGVIYVPKGSKEDYMNKEYISSVLTDLDWTIEEF